MHTSLTIVSAIWGVHRVLCGSIVLCNMHAECSFVQIHGTSSTVRFSSGWGSALAPSLNQSGKAIEGSVMGTLITAKASFSLRVKHTSQQSQSALRRDLNLRKNESLGWSYSFLGKVNMEGRDVDSVPDPHNGCGTAHVTSDTMVSRQEAGEFWRCLVLCKWFKKLLFQELATVWQVTYDVSGWVAIRRKHALTAHVEVFAIEALVTHSSDREDMTAIAVAQVLNSVGGLLSTIVTAVHPHRRLPGQPDFLFRRKRLAHDLASQ